MIEIDFDAILDNLDRGRARKKEIALTKAQAEINAINREYEAYVDGCYDAVKQIKIALEKEQKKNAQT